MNTIEQHAAEKWGWAKLEAAGRERPYPSEWLFEAMKVHFGWVKGFSCTREEFDGAADEVAALPIG